MAHITGAHTSTETSWIHLDSLEDKSDESRDDLESWVSFKSEDEPEFEEPEMYETKSYCASGQASGRLDCGRNNSKWPLICYYCEHSKYLWYLETLIPRRAGINSGRIRKRTNSNLSNV